MYHCTRRGRGVHIKQGALKNVIFRNDSSYEEMLEKCINKIYPELDKSKYDFYIADSRGSEVCSSKRVKIQQSDGSTDEWEWSLLKYPSKTFFCVKRAKGIVLQLYLCNLISCVPSRSRI